jgi:hypothetical protein
MEVGDQLQDPAPWYPLKRRLGGAHTQSDRVGEWKNSQPLPGPETPIIKPAAQRYTTELSRLRGIRNAYKITVGKPEKKETTW